jgi:phage portal protein BeeE
MLLTTPNALGSRIKERMVLEWMKKYDAVKSGRRPMILDADLKPHPLSNQSFRELDFETSVEKNELKILKALGVPPLLLDSGNNANISPNLKLFYEQTILPILHKFISSYETFYGYSLEPDIFKVRALRPELQDAGNFYSSMVTTGIMTPNEARKELRQPPSSEPHADTLMQPANIAGSAANPNVGGRPSEDNPPKPKPTPKPKPKPKPSEDKK